MEEKKVEEKKVPETKNWQVSFIIGLATACIFYLFDSFLGFEKNIPGEWQAALIYGALIGLASYLIILLFERRGKKL
jgi:hypothetical protein